MGQKYPILGKYTPLEEHLTDLDHGAEDDDEALHDGPALHVARVPLDQVQVSSLRPAGHTLELTHYLK